MREIAVINPDGSRSSTTIPDSAVPIPPDGLQPGTQAATADSMKSIYDHMDKQDLAKQQLSYDNWLLNAARARDLGMDLPPKPRQLTGHAVRLIQDADGVLWVIVETAALGSPCPDLPPAKPQQPPRGTVQIGRHNWGMYWAQGENDNPPDDIFQGKSFTGTSIDGTSGTWMFVPHPLSSDIYGRKGWYLKIG